MKQKGNILVGIILCMSIISVYGQDQNPSSLKWQQIRTPHFTVVFPKNIVTEAQRTANYLESVYIPDNRSLHQKTAPINVYLFNQSTMSNGFTTLAPRHIVDYTTPPQQATLLGGADWMQILSVHEYRHAVQFSKLDNDLISLAGAFFGDYGRLFCMNLTTPVWAFEGDAVCQETALTHEGRGRLPSFNRDYRAMALEWKRFTYHEALFGSYKKYLPDYYHLGYLMTSYIRRTYGDSTWNQIWGYVPRLPISPWRFTKGIRKYTGYGLNRTFYHTFTELQHNSQKNQTLVTETPEDTIYRPVNKVWTSYYYPYYINKNSFVALKNGLDDAPKLVLVSGEREEKLLDINPVDRIHSNGKEVVWSEETADLRWGQRSFSDVIIYSLTDHHRKRLTTRKKLFAPAISPSGDTIAALEYGTNMQFSLVLLSAVDGSEIGRFPFAEGDIVRMPTWSADGKKLVFTRTHGQKKYLGQINLTTGQISDIHDFGYENISNPVWFGKYVLYNSPSTGIDAIHAINTETGDIFVVSVGKYGVYDPSLSPDHSHILFQDYSTEGYFVASVSSNPRLWQNIKEVPVITDSTVNTLVEQVQKGLPDTMNAGSTFDRDSDYSNLTTYGVKPYKPMLHALDIHSWAPYPESYVNGVGFAVFSNDKLNTTALTAGIDYFPSDQATREYANLTYSQFFPVFEGGVSYGRKYNRFSDINPDTITRFDEKVFRAAVTLPLNFSRGINTTTWLLTGGYDLAKYNFAKYDSNNITTYVKSSVSALEFTTVFKNLKQKSLRDIDYRQGQEITVHYWHSLSDSKLMGNRFNLSAILHLPGFFDDHAISLDAVYEKSMKDYIYGIYQLTSTVEFVRGYTAPLYDEFYKGTVNYTFPLLYPDLSLGRVLYCKRLSANLFYDQGVATYNNQKTIYNSAGLDLNTQLYIFSLPFPINIGVRISHRFRDNGNLIQLLLIGQAL